MARIPVLSASLIWMLGAAAAAQSMEERLQKKLEEPWLKKAAWITDYDRAREESRKTGRPIFAYFTRSYAY